MNAERKNIKYITGLVAVLIILSIAFMSSIVKAEESSPVSTRTQTVENNEEVVRFDYHSDAVNVLVTLTNPADLPENAELSVTPVAITEDMQASLDQEAINKQKAIESASAFDIKFLVDGQEVQPGNTVKVQVSMPEITANTDTDVYHFDETAKTTEDMNAAVTPEGQVEFDAPHFSTYIIVNTNNNPITVIIQHYNDSNSPIYADDIRQLQPGDRINDYKKAVNWTVNRVVEIDKDGNETEIADKDNIMLAKSTTLRVYYSPKSGQKIGDTTFFDYLVKPVTEKGVTLKEQSINWQNNYNPNDAWNINAKNSGTVNNKNHRFSVGINNNYENYPDNQYTGLVNNTGKNINGWTGNSSIVSGIVTGLSGGEDGYKDVNFNYNFYTPDLFSMNEIENSIGKKVVDDYKLVFSQNGDKLTLTQVNDQNGKSVVNNMNQFFPLDSLMSAQKNGSKNTTYEYNGQKVYDAFDGNSWSTYGHNYYFGMRYDIEFTLNDYIGELNYQFTGDDDLWVILDGKQVVIDLGGIHNAATGKANLWDYIKDTEGNAIAQNGEGRTEAQKSQVHRLTVLYMERGGNVSNCRMNFTIPNAKIVDVTPTPKAELKFTKVNAQGDVLSGANFKLSNDTTELIATSDENGIVSFQGLKAGEYSLIETNAPDGYTASSVTWKVIVTENEDGTIATAKLYESDGTTEVQDNKIINYTSQEIINKSLDYHKTATVDDWDARTYNVHLDASSKIEGDPGKVVPYDVVLVLDKSGSMGWNMYDYTLWTGSEFFKKQTYYIKTASGIYQQIERQTSTTAEYKDTEDKSKTKTIDLNASHPDIFTRKESENKKNDALEKAATQLLDMIKDSGAESRVGVVQFDGSATTKTVKSGKNMLNIQTDGNLETLKNWVNISPDGATNAEAGMENAEAIFENTDAWEDVTDTTTNREKMVIFLTDGVPTTGSDFSPSVAKGAEEAANNIAKDGASIYALGIFDSADEDGKIHKGTIDQINAYMKGVASSDANYMTADSVDSLKNLFETIGASMGKSIVGTVTDTIDKRFELTDQGKAALASQGAQYTVNGDGTTTITWNGVNIKPQSGETPGWESTFQIRARKGYLGDNAVTTNQGNATIVTDYGTATMAPPEVNVKAELNPADAETTIFWGETLPTEGDVLKAALLEKILPTGTINADYGITANMFSISGLDDYNPTPENDKTYHITVTYTPHGATPNSNTNTTKDNVTHTVTAIDADAIYTVHVVKGQLEITKTINEQYTNIKQINANQTFVFKIERYGVNANDGSKGQLEETFYETINFNANENKTKLAKTISGLKKGYYTVTEETSWSPKYNLKGTTDNYTDEDKDAKDLFIGQLQSAPTATTLPQYYGLDNTKIGNEGIYSKYATGETAKTGFENTLKTKNDGWKWLSDTAAAVNVFNK